MFDKERRAEERLASRLAEVAALLTAMISIVALIGLDRTTVIAVVLPIAAISLFVAIASRRIVEVRRIPITIALGGSTGVGKTVFANVVSGRLSEGDSPLLAFVPETRTAQHVYRVISGLRRGEWPPRTGSDNIDRYRGIVELSTQSLATRLLRGRLEFELEIGDSAGELWNEMRERESEDFVRLIDSSFFEYVGEGSALFYFIDAGVLTSAPAKIADQVDDLLSTLQVLRSLERGGAQTVTKPIALLISKADLLEQHQHELLTDLLDGKVAAHRELARESPFGASLDHLAYLSSVMDRQAGAFAVFVVSSLRDSRAMARGSESAIDADEVVRPIEWVLRTTLASTRRPWPPQ